MATTTPNFGWAVPTSTDLVKDGAVAIETLGDSIDASLVDLKGGTTGQVLAKASNTDMDFSWVAQDDSNAIQNAIVDAKGDLIAATAADTPARLPVGTNNQVLTADSSTATGLKWATPTASASGLTLIASTTFSAVATQNFDSVFSATYKSYLVVIDDLYSSSSGNDLLLAFRYSGSTQSAQYYGASVAGNYTGGSVSSLGTDNGSALSIANASGSSGDAGSGFFYISKLDAKPVVNGAFYASVTATTNFFAGNTTQSRTYDGFQLTAGGANLTGRVSIYGLAV